jgi:hypothetical protein
MLPIVQQNDSEQQLPARIRIDDLRTTSRQHAEFMTG